MTRLTPRKPEHRTNSLLAFGKLTQRSARHGGPALEPTLLKTCVVSRLTYSAFKEHYKRNSWLSHHRQTAADTVQQPPIFVIMLPALLAPQTAISNKTSSNDSYPAYQEAM